MKFGPTLMTQGQNKVDWVEIASTIVTNFVVILGWIIVFRQAINLRKRDDVRKTVDLISATCDEIYKLACIYYSDRNNSHINYNSTNLKAKFVLLSHYLLLLRGASVRLDISATLNSFKNLATGGYFETVNFPLQESLPNWQTNLAATAHELKFRVEKAYFDWSAQNDRILRLFSPVR